MRKIAAMICVLSFSGGCSGPPPAHSAESQGATPASSGRTRTYFIAADEMTWDYAPSGRNVTEERAFSDIEAHWMVRGPHEPGRIYKKALYREYTDASFATLKPRPAEWMHLGLLGPLIRAEVGDTIQVVFRNNARFPASVHPHGVFYNKDSEGARYGDGTSGADKADDGVPTGMTQTYTWQVPERAGPGAHDGSSVFWMYHSHVEEARDVASGLLGPMIVTRRGMARADGSPTDVDRELVAGFMEVDENLSWYVEDNIKANTTDPKGIRLTTGPSGETQVTPGNDNYFRETINGLSYSNLTGLTMKMGERVRWYLLASTNFEFHAPHWHGNVVTSNQMRTDVGMLLPMGMMVADMVPDNPGRWLLHCHVADHMRMGMQALYTVEK